MKGLQTYKGFSTISQLYFGMCNRFNLETAVERGKAVYDMHVHREFTTLLVTLWVMRVFLISLGA